MASSRSRSNSSRSVSSKKRSVSKSPQKINSRDKSYQKDRKKISNSRERQRSPGRGSRRNADLIPKSAKLFVTNIDSSIKAEELQTDLTKQFAKFGKIKSITIKTKNDSRNSFAFIEFERVEDAEAAITTMKGFDFKGKQLKVQFGKGQRKQQDRRADKCYICHKEGHFAKDCRYRDRSRDRKDSRDYHRRRKYSRSSSSSRSHRRRRSYDRDREYRRRDRDYRRSPDRSDRRRQYNGQRQRRQRY